MKAVGNYRDLRTVRTSEGTFVNAVDLIRQARIEAKDRYKRALDEEPMNHLRRDRQADADENWIAWLSAVVEYSNEAIDRAEKKANPETASNPDCNCAVCKMVRAAEAKKKAKQSQAIEEQDPPSGSPEFFEGLKVVPLDSILPPLPKKTVEEKTIGQAFAHLLGSYFSKKPPGEVGSSIAGNLSPGGMGLAFIVASDGKTYVDAEGLIEKATIWAQQEMPKVHAGKPPGDIALMRNGVASVVLFLRNAIREVRERLE